MKKIFKNLIILFFVFIVFCIPQKMIFGKANFPDSSKLQPAPANVLPNISGNINYNNDKNDVAENFQDPADNFIRNLIIPNLKTNNSDDNKELGFILKIIVFFVISIIFLIIFLFVIKNKK
jgi:hypothetical protein